MKQAVNLKNFKKCAFCKYWYDPTNEHIAPKAPNINVWTYETSARCKCIKRNLTMSSTNSCAHYDCKVPIN